MILSVYNGQAYLAECVKSVLAQTLTDFEFLIVDDGSSDGSAKLLQKFSQIDSRTHLQCRERNMGMGYNYRELLAAARGDYIAQIGHDDRWSPDFLAGATSRLDQNPSLSAVFSDVQVIRADGSLNTAFIPFETELLDKMDQESLICELLKRNFLCASSSLIRRKILDGWTTLGSNDQLQDWCTWQALALRGRFERLPRKLVDYRVTGQNLSLSGKNRMQLSFEEMTSRYQMLADPAFSDVVLNSAHPERFLNRFLETFDAVSDFSDPALQAAVVLALKNQETKLSALPAFREWNAIFAWNIGALSSATRTLKTMQVDRWRHIRLVQSFRPHWLICAPAGRLADSYNPFVTTWKFGFLAVVRILLPPNRLPWIWCPVLKSRETVERRAESLIGSFRRSITQRLVQGAVNVVKRILFLRSETTVVNRGTSH